MHPIGPVVGTDKDSPLHEQGRLPIDDEHVRLQLVPGTSDRLRILFVARCSKDHVVEQSNLVPKPDVFAESSSI